MKKKMLQFVDLKQETPEKEVRLLEKDFNEIYNEFITEKQKISQAGVLNVEFLLPNSLSIR